MMATLQQNLDNSDGVSNVDMATYGAIPDQLWYEIIPDQGKFGSHQVSISDMEQKLFV